MSLMLVGVGLVIELKTERGLSPTFAGFLGAVLATFSAANCTVSRDFMKSRSGGSAAASLDAKIEQMHELTMQMNNPENLQALTNLLSRVDQGLSDVKATTGQVGTAMINVGQDVKNLARAVGQR